MAPRRSGNSALVRQPGPGRLVSLRQSLNGRIAINGCMTEPLSESEEQDMPDGNGFPDVIVFTEPGLLSEKTIWTLQVNGVESLPWFESPANMKNFALDYPEICQVCIIAYGIFILRTTLKPSEGDSPRMLVERLRSSLRTLRITATQGYCTKHSVQQILWTRPHDHAL